MSNESVHGQACDADRGAERKTLKKIAIRGHINATHRIDWEAPKKKAARAESGAEAFPAR